MAHEVLLSRQHKDLPIDDEGDGSLSTSSPSSGYCSIPSCSSYNSKDSVSETSESLSCSSVSESSYDDDDSIGSDYSNNGDMADLEDELFQFLQSHGSATVSSWVEKAGLDDDGSNTAIDVQDEEMLSKVKQDLLRLGNIFASQGAAFKERAATLASINYLSANIPSSVLDHVGREVRQFAVKPSREKLAKVTEHEVETQSRNRRFSFYSADSDDHLIAALPYVAPFQSAVLFLDITGFTSMSALHGPETVTKLTNKYFQIIVKNIFDFDGDIQKYAGDALFAEWRQTPERSLQDCVYLAAVCACKIAQELTDYPMSVRVGAETITIKMNHHSGIGCGETVGIHIGDSIHRREYLHVGDSIAQATDACKLASSGEVAVSQDSGALVRAHNCDNTSDLPDVVTVVDRGEGKLIVTMTSNKLAQRSTFSSCVKRPEEIALSRAITRHVDGLDLDALKEYRRLISLYCHPVVKASDLAAKTFSSGISHGLAVEPELRDVCVAFLGSGLELHKSSPKNGTIDYKTINKINRIRNIVSRELINFHGCAQSFIDDKGFSILLTFGLRGCAFPELVPQLALPAIMMIRNELESEEDVFSKVGATYGKVHCGFVGGDQRHEYTVLGKSANLAARLMTSSHNKSILVDRSVYAQCLEQFDFDPVASIAAKGFSEPVMTYLPLERFLAATSVMQQHEDVFVGRKEEQKSILSKAKRVLHGTDRSTFVLVSGSRGIGKSALLLQMSTAIQELSTNLMVSGFRHLSCKMFNRMTPFSGVVSLVRGMLRTAVRESILVGCSKDELSVLSRSGVWKHNCDEDLSIRTTENSSLDLELLGAVTTRVLRNFSEKVDLLCLCVDDCHWLDQQSWSVFQNLLGASGIPNLFLLGTSISFDADSFRMSDETKHIIWHELKEENRYTVIEISELASQEIEDMVCRLTDADTVSSELLKDVIVESGGVPLYVRQTIHGVYREDKSVGIYEDPGLSRINTEILVHQLDDLPSHERQCLNIAACLGKTFSGNEIASIWDLLFEEDDEAMSSEAVLTAVVDRGLLRLVCPSADPAEARYEFRRLRWKNAIWELVPDSKKRFVAACIRSASTMKLMSAWARPKSKSKPEGFDGFNPAMVIG